MIIRWDPWKQGKGKCHNDLQSQTREFRELQVSQAHLNLQQDYEIHTERISWQQGPGHQEQNRPREVTDLQGCHQRAPLLQAQEEFGYPEKKVAEEMEHLWGLQWPVRQGSWWLAPKLGPSASLMGHETSSCWFWETYCLECCHLIKEDFYLRGPRAFPGVKSLQRLQQHPAQLPCTLLLVLVAAKWPSHQGLPVCCLVSGCHIFLYQL